MRQTISGLVAAMAIMTASAAPAAACGGLFTGYTPCHTYVSPCAHSCGGHHHYSGYYGGAYAQSGYYAHERLPDPSPQYYYVNQGPTYSGPGNFAPYPTYQESAVSGWGAYRNTNSYYGYDGGQLRAQHNQNISVDGQCDSDNYRSNHFAAARQSVIKFTDCDGQ